MPWLRDVHRGSVTYPQPVRSPAAGAECAPETVPEQVARNFALLARSRWRRQANRAPQKTDRPRGPVNGDRDLTTRSAGSGDRDLLPLRRRSALCAPPCCSTAALGYPYRGNEGPGYL